MIIPFLKDQLSIHDTWLFLKHIRGCDACRDELDLESIILSASDPDMTDAGSFDFSHHLDELILKKQQRIRTCMITDLLDVFLLLVIFTVLLIGIF